MQIWEFRDSFSLFSTSVTIGATWATWTKGVAALHHPALDPKRLAELISGSPVTGNPKQATGACSSRLDTFAGLMLSLADRQWCLQVVVRLAQFAHAMRPCSAAKLGGGVPEMRTRICDCRDSFLLFDLNHNGKVSQSELLQALSVMGEVHTLESCGELSWYRRCAHKQSRTQAPNDKRKSKRWSSMQQGTSVIMSFAWSV